MRLTIIVITTIVIADDVSTQACQQATSRVSRGTRLPGAAPDQRSAESTASASTEGGRALGDPVQRTPDIAGIAGGTALRRDRQPHDYPRSRHHAIAGPLGEEKPNFSL